MMAGPRRWPVFPLASIPASAVRVQIVPESQSPPHSGLCVCVCVCVCVGGRGAGQVAQVFTCALTKHSPSVLTHLEVGRSLSAQGTPSGPAVRAH